MKRLGKVELKYTKKELEQILYNGIVESQKVSIESMEVISDDEILFHCVEGVNTITQLDQLEKISLNFLTPLSTNKPKLGSLKKAVLACLENGVQCPMETMIKELNLKGFNRKAGELKAYILYSSSFKNKPETEIIEVTPNVLQLKSFFNQIHNG